MGWVRGLMAAYCIILLQVMGYVAAFRKDEEIIPVALVITETLVDILFFPFVHTSDDTSDERLLTAAHLPLHLWKSRNQIEVNCLVLLAYLSDVKDYRIVLHTAEDHEKMRKITKISTDSASDKERLEQIERELVEMGQQLEREKKRDKETRQELHKARQELKQQEIQENRRQVRRRRAKARAKARARAIIVRVSS